MNQQSNAGGWPSIANLIITEGTAPLAILGAPMGEGSVTPGRCDLAPGLIRQTLRRFSTYDVETRRELDQLIFDAGDVPLEKVMPAEGFTPIRDAVARCTAAHGLTLLLGGNNAVTRPAAHGLGLPLERVGLITLDAHFDLRDTDLGPRNGNPIRCLLEDGLPGRNVCQIGLSPFANTRHMHETADGAGIGVTTMAEVKRRGIIPILEEALARIDHAEAVMIDFDIDVIDRAQCPGAPGARPGGMPVDMFFAAARFLAAQPKVRLVDLTEFDPSLDVDSITALTAARWVCEIAAGHAARGEGA
jgi:arginase family enzyme